MIYVNEIDLEFAVRNLSPDCAPNFLRYAREDGPTIYFMRWLEAGYRTAIILPPYGRTIMLPPRIVTTCQSRLLKAQVDDTNSERILKDIKASGVPRELVPSDFFGLAGWSRIKDSAVRGAKTVGSKVRYGYSNVFAYCLVLPEDKESIGTLLNYVDEWFGRLGEFAARPLGMPLDDFWNLDGRDKRRRSYPLRIFEAQPSQFKKWYGKEYVSEFERLVAEVEAQVGHCSISPNDFLEPPGLALSCLRGWWPNFTSPTEITEDAKLLESETILWGLRGRLVRLMGFPLFYEPARYELDLTGIETFHGMAPPTPRELRAPFDSRYELYEYGMDMERRFPILGSPLVGEYWSDAL